ncbi:MAG: dTMP kinase, partial [SAR324 cluster bacterium]|nr:dTMP kinase [SAR324 cluster bacterium]
MESTTHKQSLKSAFITLEGIDGCGKTTQAKLLAERLRQLGTLLVETREPGGTAVGRALRQVLLDPDNLSLAPETELLLF